MTHFPYRKALSGWFLVAALLVGPTTLLAEESPPISTPEAEMVAGQTIDLAVAAAAAAAAAEVSYWEVATKLGIGLCLVVVLAWGAVFLLRKSAIGQQFGEIGKTIRIAERTYISPKKAIYLVEIGDRMLALGVTEEQITALSEWQSGELELTPTPERGGTFSNHFKNLLKQGQQEESA